MTTYYDFTPNNTHVPPYAFQPLLDGQTYSAAVVWNMFGQRWYLTLADLSGKLIFNQALVGSSPAVNIESLTWADGTVTLIAAAPHAFTVGQTFDLTVNGCTPDAYNGRFRALVVDEVTLTYPLAVDPSEVSALGQGTYDINLAGGYFQTSSLVFRQGSQKFEVSP